MSAISFENVHIAYDAEPVVRGVDLAVAEGELHVLLGASGSGKTTLLRAVAGVERIAQGRLELFGRVVDGEDAWVPPERRGVGVVFQGYALFPHLDVAGNVGFGIDKRALDRGQRIAQLLDQVGLDGYATRPVADLSGGEQQRVALARALAQAPRAMLLDEPFSNLNPGLRQRLRDTTIDVLRQSGVAAIFVTHDRHEAFAIADRLSVIDAGELLQTGTPREVYQHPRTLAAARSVGETVELPATCEGSRAQCALGALEVSASGSGPGTLVLRPEQLRVAPGEGASVVERRFYGSHDELTLVLADAQRLSARAQPGAFGAGDQVAISVEGPGAFFARSAALIDA